MQSSCQFLLLLLLLLLFSLSLSIIDSSHFPIVMGTTQKQMLLLQRFKNVSWQMALSHNIPLVLRGMKGEERTNKTAHWKLKQRIQSSLFWTQYLLLQPHYSPIPSSLLLLGQEEAQIRKSSFAKKKNVALFPLQRREEREILSVSDSSEIKNQLFCREFLDTSLDKPRYKLERYSLFQARETGFTKLAKPRETNSDKMHLFGKFFTFSL